MQTLLYKLNNSKDYGFYAQQEVFTKGEAIVVMSNLAKWNGVSSDKVKIIVADESDKVVLSTPKLGKEEKAIILKRMNYTFKRGV